MFSQILMQSALKKRVPCTILFATETGKSQTFAKKLKSMLSSAFNPRVRKPSTHIIHTFHAMEKLYVCIYVSVRSSISLLLQLLCMEDYNFQDLKNERFMMVITSTFGNGDPPGNGEVCHIMEVYVLYVQYVQYVVVQ